MKLAVRLTLAGVVLVFAFTALYVAAFHAPRPHGVDVAVVGSTPRLDPRAFDVHHYASEAQARSALLDTEVRGVFTGDRVLVASAAGIAPAEAIAAAGRGRPVEDLRPLPPSDNRGLSPLFVVIGTLIPGLVFGVMLSVAGRELPVRVRWAAITGFALLAGLVAAFNVDVLVGALDGQFAGIALVTALLALAVAAAAHGLGRLAGPAGIITAVLLMLVLGVSSAGGAVTHQFEPGFYRAVSQVLPPGAALTAVRNVQYFDWAGTLVPLLTLGAWAAGGIAAGLLGERVSNQRFQAATGSRAQR